MNDSNKHKKIGMDRNSNVVVGTLYGLLFFFPYNSQLCANCADKEKNKQQSPHNWHMHMMVGHIWRSLLRCLCCWLLT